MQEKPRVRFTVEDLRRLASAVGSGCAADAKNLSDMLHRRQPDFCEIIDEVGMDPRCVDAHSFCVQFCALAFQHAERHTGCRLRKYPGSIVHEAMCLIAQGKDGFVGKRACTYPARIRRHVLADAFDHDDSGWLCTTISGFLFVTETALRANIQMKHRTMPST